MTIRPDRIPVRHVLGVPIHAVTPEEVLELCREVIATRQTLTLGVVNAAKIVNMKRDRLLRESVLGADLVLADGMAVVWASRLLGQPLPGRVTGIDLFLDLLKLANEERWSVYFLGASSEVLHRLLTKVRESYPNLEVAGYRDGYFKDDEAAEVASAIDAARPDLLFVGITSPKKELFLEAWGAKMDIRVCHGVGGSFDVLSGKTARAPEAWQRAGFEWLYRILQEPGRLWKRYMVTNSLFMAMIARDLLRRLWRRP